MQDKPLRKLYTSLKSNNYDVPDNYESFERTLTQAGQAGAQSRRALHESLKKDNYDVPDNYDSFYKSLFTPVNSTTSMAIGSEPVKPAPQKPTTSTTTGTPQHTVQPTKPAPAQPVRPQQVQKPQGKPMTAAQKAAAIGWAQGLTAQTKANTQRAMQKIKNIGKYQKAQGVYGQTKKGNIEYNPQTGKMEQTYLTPQGEQTTHKATADLASHEFRVQQGFLSRMSDNGLNPDNPEDVAKQRQLDKEHPIRDVLDSVWKEAEGIDKQAQEELRSKASSGFSLSTLAEASNSAGAPLAGHDRNFNDELSYQEKRHKAFDFDKMANTIYNRLPKDYRNDRLREYTAYFSKHPKEAKGKSAVAAAKDALMGQIYNNVYSHAVQERLPKSNLEFLLRKVADQPLISSKAAAEFAASSRTGSHGLEVAERDAMAQFGSQHKAMNIMGTVANMALDPITYVSGGVGGFVGKKALGLAGKAMLGKVAEKATEKAVGKVATDVASRYAAGTLAGRVVQGVAGGAANFATFNTLKGIEEQVATGGVVNPETGKSEGFSVGEILKSTGHGLLLGAATGTLSPIIGNFADKAVKATTSTVGKVALRVGETAVSTLAEGTVFSIPEWISGQGDAFDVWTNNMAMMLGFKASHAIKSAPRVLDALRTDGKRYGFSFKERLNKQMEASPSDAGFTSEELDELRNNGYMDLFMLFRNAQKQKSTSPKSHEVSKEVVDDYENLTPDTFDGYEAMKRLMNDKGVSEATRAKAYYILTGRMLPMSTITGYTTDKTEDGDIVVKSMSAQGDVVTSRQFTNEKAAQGEIDKIMRQSELNSVDVGEKYKETASNMLVVETAIKEVAPDADMETVLQNYRKVKSGQEDMPQELIDQAKAIDAAIERNRDIADANRPEAIRAKLNKETGLDVDATLRKMPKNRTEEEKELVDTYIKSLFPEQEKTEDGQTADVQADTEYKQRIEERQQAYDEGKEAFNVADTEGDNSDTDAIVLRYREAYDEIERVFADDAEMRIAQLEEDPWEVMNDQSLTPEQQDAVAYFVNSKAAMDGLTEAANENSENKRAEAEHKIVQRTNKQSGMIHPATLKVDDKQVYIVSGNVTMFPDGSTVDIHHSSESVVVCDAETGELKFISPEQIFKVDEPVDPSMELQAVDEAISAEQQAILGNEAETEVSESEEIPEQEENEQPQPIQQDDAVEETNLDVQNEDEVNLPQNEDLQPSNETIEDDLPQQPETALQRIPKGENGEPLLEQTDPETAWDGVVEYMEDADDAQEYVESMVAQLTKDVENAKKAVSKVKPSADMAKFKADKAAARQIQADAEARLDKWLQISNVNKARKQSELNRINAERAEADRIAREKAVAELAEQKRVEAEKKAEQEAIGAHAVNPKIKEKWDAAPKVVGNADIITLPDGSKLRGHYVLTEAGAATASHDVNNAYKPTEGFPIDENGQSVNDRDYERDEDARKISRSIADNYDSRALQSVTVVDNNGITLSGNGRNIAGELAAQQGTDGAYIDYLREFPQKYGLTAEQVQSIQHPRVHFVPDEVLPYDAATFARFNAQEMKSQSKPEAAVKLGKVVPDNTFGHIVRSLAQYDRLSDFYANEKDANGAIMELVKAGVVNDKQLPELRTGDALSAAGRELLENTLIGKVFQSNPDAVRQIIAQPGIKQSIVMALSEIAHNRTLANGYDLSEELSNAVDLVARAKQADPDTYKEGMPVSPFGRQQGLFDDELGDKRVTDATTLLLADILNSTKPSDLRKVLATYNAEGETAANGQLDIFSGDLRNKEEILTDINKHFINATPKEQQALVDAAIAERKRRAAEAAATEQSGGNDTAEQAASVETSSGQPQPVETTPIGTTSTPDEVQAQREQTETNPTEAQKEAGNYRKGHIKVDGYDIALENPKGSTRSGKDANGKEWSITMKHDYGYIRGTKGTDGDHIDVYLSDNPTAGNVYVVDQIDQQTGDFDEHKVMYGFNSMEEAVQAYREQYEDGWKVGTITEVSREEFKKWVDSSARKTKPFADYKTVKPLETEHTQSGENYAHNSEEIMHEDVKPTESSEKYTITPTQYTNKKGKTSDMYLVKFNHELSKEEKVAAKSFISEPLAEGKRTPRGWYDREQEGYMVRSEDTAKQLGDMMADEVAVADQQPVTVKDYRNAVAPAATHNEQEKKPSNTVSVEDAAIQDIEAKVYKPENKEGGLDFNGDVSKEDFNDALKDLRSLLGVSDDEGDVGVLFRDGEELTKEQRKKIKAAGLSVTQVLVDNGMVKFSDYAGKMVSLIGDKIRPWLKSFYEGIRWEPGYESVEFTPSDEVARFDVQNFDKPTPDVLKQAEMVVAEQKAAKISKQTEQEVRTERNEKRKEDEKQAEANTTAITEEAGAVASKARTVAKRATTDTEVRKATEEVEAALEKVNNQLALLGYYEADKVAKDFNEAYGYMRNAEKKAVKDATTLAKRIADDLGVDIYEATHTAPGKNGKRKSKPLAVANIAPIGGEITIHLPLEDGKDLSIYINLKANDAKGSLTQGDNLEVGNIMYRLEKPNASGQERYGRNNFVSSEVAYNELLDGIRRITDSTEVRDKSNPDIKSYLAEHLNSIAKDKSIQQIINPATGNSEEVIRYYLANELPGYVIDHFTNYADPKVKTLLEYVTGDKSLSKEENKKNLDLIIDALIDRARSILKDGEDVEEFHGGEQVYSLKHGAYKHILAAFHGSDGKTEYYTFSDGTKANANEVQKTEPQRDLTEENSQPVIEQPTNNKLLAQYNALKEKHPDTKILLRVGDFYETYQDDAKDLSKTLGIVLTKRNDGVNMVGFPYHALDTYLPKLIRAGYRVAINEQLELPKTKEDVVPNGTPQPKKVNVESLVRELQDKGKTRLSEHTEDEKATTQKEKPTKKNNSKKKDVSLNRESTVGDLFGDLFGNNDLDNKDNEDNQRTRRENRKSDDGVSQRESSERRTVDNRQLDRDIEERRFERQGDKRVQSRNAEERSSTERPSGRLSRLNVSNNHAERGVDYAPTSADARIEANIKAIELANELVESGEKATPEQMSVLRKFSGWGGLGKAFNQASYSWSKDSIPARLQSLLGAEGYEQAVMSANSAYYTPAYVIDTLWDIAKQMGFKGGNILEGSAGIGNILGLMPMDISDSSRIQAVEIDGTSGNILSLLYPEANVNIQGFEQTRVPNGSVDLAITNVPFVTGLRVNDTTGDGDLSKKFHNIHDFCIAKNVRKLREGGIGIFISSNGTLDSSQKLRDWLVSDGNADVVGAFRLNNKTFGGTGVTSDIIVIRKRVNGQVSPNAIDVSTVTGERSVEFDTGETKRVKGVEVPVVKHLSMDYNKYFIEHPEMMAGKMEFAFEHGDKYRATSKGLYPTNDKAQDKLLADFVQSFTNMKDEAASTKQDVEPINVYEELGNDVKEGSMLVNKDGQLCVAQLGQAVPLNLNTNKVKGHTKEECFMAYTEIKQALNDVLKYQTENESNEGLQPLLDKLNKAYDSFVDTYGHLNKNTSIAFLRNDVDYPNVFSLEKYEEKADKNGNRVESFHKTDIFKKRVVEKSVEPQPKNVKDGIVVSVYKFGKIDIPYISNQLGKTEEDVKREIIASGLGFENPVSKQVEVSYQYLSGNVREKLKQAEENNEDGEYNTNIKALKEVVPNSIPAHLIEFNLGSSWIAPELYEEYVKDKTDVDVKFTAAGGTWFMKEPHWTDNEKNRSFGVHSDLLGKHVMGHELIEAAIQNKTITVSTTRKHYDGTSETITDKEATQACSSRIDEIRQEFKDWARNKMQSNPEMSDKIEQVYNDLFNNYVPIDIPSEYIPEHFGGATHNITLRSHQAKAVVRGTMQPLMLAHEVGTGKTFTLISTAMEMRRLGTARKPMIVVQNATVGQFVASAKELYPNAKILTLEDSDRNAEGRKNFYAKIRYNDWDMIVVPQSTFEFIPDSEERQMTFIQDKIEEKLTVLAKMKDADKSGRNLITRQAEKEVEQLKEELADLTTTLSEKRTAKDEKKRAVTKQNTEVKAREMLERRTDETENFDDMGIDALLIDEAHEYKHLGFATAMQRGVKGVDPSYSKKSQGVFLKTQAVLQKSHGRNVIFATGTPISNTAAEIWTFMRYLMPSETMKEYGIYYFDDFVRNFGNIQQMLEFTTSGKFKENNRFAGYIDLPELVRIWSSVSDTVRTKDAGEVSDKIPEMEGDKAQDLYLPQTPALRGIMKYVKAELEAYDKMSGKEKKENSHIPLTMYSIAKAAAVDARLVDETAEDDPNSKTNEAVRQTLRSLKETASYNGTVALFADNYQNKTSGFNLYEDVKDKLIAAGIPEKQIVVMKSGMTVKKKLEIFDKVNRGEVRVIMGSTFTLGTGVNIQERLHTLIHIDAPNRPMDYTQRNGRILRQGNIHKDMNKPVRVLRFGVEDSLDVTAYQRLKTKGAIAESIMNGKQLMANSMENRILEEEEDSFGDTVAQLSGSEYAMLKNQAEKNVRKYESRKRQWEADQTYIHNAKPRLNGLIKKAQLQKEENEKNLSLVNNTYPDGKFKAIIVGKHKYDSVAGMEDFFKEHNKKVKEESEKVKNGTNATYGSTINVDVDGLTFAIHTEVSKEMSSQGINLFAKSTRTMTYSQKELGLEDVPVKGALMRNAIEDITDNIITGNDFKESIERATQNIAHYSSDLEHILSREGKPFEFESELEEAKAKFVEYTEAMKKEMEEKEKKYAEMDKNIDANSNLSNIEYEDGNFSELTAEEPLFNVSSSIRSFIEGNLFSEVDFSDSPNKNVNQAISKLTDDELLKEIAKGDSKEWNFYMEEYDRRHNKEFQEAVERYMNSLEDEKTSLDTAYGSYVNVAKNWSNGGYHTTERTLLRAQLDAIEDYVSKKESEQLSSVESEAYHQAKETVRKVGYDLTRLRLRPLEEGEACHVERRYTESNGFSFTGKEHIESIEDIAYIFKQLETSSVENSFLVLIKDGTPTVLHLSIGSYATALAPIEQAIVAADAINPDKVLFVHNHPSGNISASKQDMDVQKKMKEIFGGKVMPAIIINTTSGKFGMFSEDGRLEDGNIPLPDEHNNIPINVYQFSQQVFAKDWNPEFAFRAVSPESIAEYVSSHRLGEHKKMSLIILDQAGHVTGNVFLPWTKLTDVDSHKNIMQIISYVNQMGGRSAILYGNYELAEDTRDTNKSIFKIKTAFSNSALHLMDVINIDDSALDRGAMEEDVEYGKRNLDEEVNEQFNRELAELTEKNAQSKRLKLGQPSPMLSTAGVPDKPIILYGNKLLKKSKLHNFDVKELHNLPLAMQNPIAVFEGSHPNSFATLLEIKLGGYNTLASIEVNKKGEADFNIISSLFGKESKGVTKWILDGKLLSVDKEKAQSYISASALNADATYKNELSSAAKIVKDFVNPSIRGEKSSLQEKIDPQDTTPQVKALQAKVLSEKLNTPIRVVSDPAEISELPSRRQQRAKGWWSAKNDEVVILLPNNADVADVANTVVHEVVGHKGLRKLIGEERFDEFLDEVYDHATNPIRTAIDEAERKLFDTEVDRLTQQKNAEAERPESRKGVFSRAEATVEANKKREQMRREATEEYMADMAGRIGDEGFEKMSAEELTFWGRIKARVQKFLEKFLRGLKIAKSVKLTDKDVAYILYKSWKNLRNGGKPTVMDAAEDALMRNKTNYNETDISRFRDGDMGLDETITSMKAEISAANKDDFKAKVEAMKAIGGNLQKLRSAMSRQRSYDISTAKAMTDLAQVLLDKGLLDNLSVYETKRVLSAVRNGVGKEDISGHVQKLMDIMVDNQLHSGANMLGKLFTMRGTRLNDRGIEVQGNLDPQGQILVKTARKYTSFPKEEIDNTLIPDLMSRMGSDDQTIADNAAIEYAGAQIARRYVEEITESKAEEKALRESIKTAKEDKDAGKLDADAYKQYVNATEEAIRQNKIDRAEAYSSIAAEFGGMLGESAKRAKEWREAEQKRINDIHHNCNSDMEGRITDEHHKDNKVQKLMNNDIVRFFLAPLGTFDQMLRMFGKKNVNGEGYLWNRFMRSWVDATENEYIGYRDDLKELDAKVSEVYGKKMKWADLFTLERKMGKVPVEFWDGGERKLHELTQGNLLYIYMVDKMSDGRMKLRYMGITEQDVQHITEILDPKFKELADWLQEEYLVNKRNKYNDVHKRMFGAPMAAIDNYFPLKILKNALDKEEDVAEDDNAGIVLPGTTTNGIIKRTRNNKPLDVTGADAFNVIADHLQEMEHWAAFAELTRDINTMLSYKRFRNQVMNMSSAYGAGAVLWKNFRSVCKMAVGAYRPPSVTLDKSAVNIAKGVTAAKVSFRVFTALKQFLSFPAYLPDSNPVYLAQSVVNPAAAWKWSMSNLPIFEKRWKSRMAGDPRLMKSDMDWKAWRSRIVEIASMIGMSPNAFVDALTVSMGAYAMYKTRYDKYKRWGFDEATADKRAKQDATILYNSTQQSSEGAFLSPMQVDRSWFTVLLSIFRNSSMSYERQEYDAFRNEVKLFTPGYRQRAEEFMIKQLQREGLTEEQAKKAAHGELRKGPLHNLARIFVFGFAIQAIWNLGAYLPYLILGDDDDEKKKMTDDALTHALFGSLEGLTGGDGLSQAGNMALQGEGNWAQVVKDMPAASDFIHILKTYSKDNVEALNDCINLLTQSAVGVNPQSITDAMVAIMDYCGDDAQTSRECALLMARILNCPQSQLDKIYFDELSASGVEASKMTPSQIAERFARYKRHRSAPLTGWMYSDAAIADKDGKRKETVYKKARENFKAAASKSNKEELEQWKAEYKETAAKLSAIKKLREQDEDEADEQMDALENTPEYDRYLIMKDYNSDMNDITKAWLNSKSPTEREQLTKAMFKVQQEMVNELKTSK